MGRNRLLQPFGVPEVRPALRICSSIPMSDNVYFPGHRLLMGKCLLRPIGLGHPCLCGEVVLHEMGVLLCAPMGMGYDPAQW